MDTYFNWYGSERGRVDSIKMKTTENEGRLTADGHDCSSDTQQKDEGSSNRRQVPEEKSAGTRHVPDNRKKPEHAANVEERGGQTQPDNAACEHGSNRPINSNFDVDGMQYAGYRRSSTDTGGWDKTKQLEASAEWEPTKTCSDNRRRVTKDSDILVWGINSCSLDTEDMTHRGELSSGCRDIHGPTPSCGGKGTDLHATAGCCRMCRVVVTVVCCFFICCTLGFCAYTFSNMNPYVTSYLRARHGDVDYTDTLWIYQAMVLTGCVVEPLLGLLANRLPTKVFMMLGVGLTAACMFGTYCAIQASLGLTIFTYGVLGGIPGSLLYPLCIRISVEWVPDKTGLVTGFNLMGYGVGGFVWTTVSTLYINGNNLQPDLHVGDDVYYSQAEVLDRVPGCFLILSIVLTSTQFICALLISSPPPSESLNISSVVTEDTESVYPPPSRAGGRLSDSAGSSDQCAPDQNDRTALIGAPPRRDYTPMEVLKSRVFWTLWLMMLANAVGVSFVLPLFKAYGQTFISDDHFLAMTVSVSSLFNAAGRPLFGVLMDRFSPRLVALVIQCALACFVATLVTCEQSGRVAFLLWMCVIFLTLCGLYTALPVILLGVFGSRHFNVVMGLMDGYPLLGSILPTLIAPALKDAFGWHGMFYLSFVALFISILLNMSFSFRCGNSIPKHTRRYLALR